LTIVVASLKSAPRPPNGQSY